jgi:hypothetical protein
VYYRKFITELTDKQGESGPKASELIILCLARLVVRRYPEL